MPPKFSPLTPAINAANYRARRIAAGWQFWQIPVPPEIVAAMAELRRRTGKDEREIVRELVEAAAADVKTDSPGRSHPRRVAGRRKGKARSDSEPDPA